MVLSFAQKWWLHGVLALLIVGSSYSALEEFFPSLRPKPSERMTQSCAQFAESMEASRVKTIAAQGNLSMHAAANNLIVKVGDGCMCILGTVDGRVRRNTLACSHSETALFEAAQ
ncbi:MULTISPECIES: hypothetical protein [unclassified Acidovorax]|jgi:hypothetical protein|uniref:hypothetical protein n=1 Tax=unclassified Acidovorax TaxID=2684926 RepID=UPI000AC66630|nr:MULTISPECIES: hypothetical protein [unclassified Acidovorax]